MSLSFEDSLNIATVEPVAEVVEEEVLSVRTFSLARATTLNTDGWTPVSDKGYRFYNGEYGDENYSTVDELKNITLDPNQINITQEQNSQYIPFQMPRFSDGFDLTETEITVFYVNENKKSHTDVPVDVYFNDEYIRFAWLVSPFATQLAGLLKFEIHGRGENSKGEVYVWKSRSYDKLNVLQSLQEVADGEIGLSEEEISDWYGKIQVETIKAQEAAKDAQEAADEALSLVNSLRDGITSEVESAVDARVETIVGEKISDQLTDYYPKSETYSQAEVDELIAEVKPVGYATETFVQNLVGDPGLDKNGVARSAIDYVDDAIESLDLTNKLGDYYTKSETYSQDQIQEIIGDTGTSKDGSEKSVVAYVDDAIAGQDITGKLGNYYTKDETYSQSEVDDKLSNVQVDLTGYAKESFVTEKTDPLASSISTNTESISSLSTVVGELQEDLASIDKSPRLTYDVVYNDVEDPDVGENVLVFYEIEHEGAEDEVRRPKRKYTITGGGGGSSSANTLALYFDTDDEGNQIKQYVFTVDTVEADEAVIYFEFTGTDTVGDSVSEADATWQLRKGNGSWSTIHQGTITPGTKIPFNVSDYIALGEYSLNLTVSDASGGFASKTWKIQQIDFKIASDFDDRIYRPMGPVAFPYTPYGAISKNVHFVLDGEEIGVVTTTYSSIPLDYQIPAQIHGSHLLEVYMTADVNGTIIPSNRIMKDILWYDGTTSPVIGTTFQKFTARQYETTIIPVTVYDPSTETPTVTIAVDGDVVSTEKLTDGSTFEYAYKTDAIGEHIITITCGDTVKPLTANITELGINVTPVTAGLVFDFDPVGKSNADEANRLWTNGTVSMSVSDDFDWTNGGYQTDENGDQYFCIKAGTRAFIDYELFADDAKKNGKEMKLIFKTTNVSTSDATFLSCMDNTTDTDHIGIQMDVQEAFVYGQAGKLHLPYSENDVIEFEFNISKDTEAIPMVMGYEDGVSTCPMVYESSHNFTQNTPQIITLGSDNCDLHIYRFKVYNTSLTDRGILNNFIADARSAEDMIDRFERNQIYDSNGNLDPDLLAEKCPWLRVIKISAPHFTNGKKYPVNNTTFEYIYEGGKSTGDLDYFKATDAVHVGQGTSSDNYGAAGRNMDMVMKSHKDFNNSPVITLRDGSVVSKVALTQKSVPTNYFNIKVNVASQENANNALLQRRYNTYNPYERPFVREEGYDTSIIKDTMEFHNAVIFIQETDEDLSTHTEFADTNWHFYAISNVGDSKKTDSTRLTDPDDRYECILEVMDVKKPLSDFPRDTMMNAMGYTVDPDTKENIYTLAKNENLGILYELIDGRYVLTSDTEVDLNKVYYVDILEHDDFSEDYTYGWRYIWEDGTDEENAEVFSYCHQKWIEMYRFVTTQTDEEFKAGFKNYFVQDSMLYYYLFTLRYTMVDNRAKNLFFHYGKTGEIDSEGNPIRKWDLAFNYDDDTALGINNYGAMVYRYGLEDTDVDENGEEVFRESDSTIFCRIRDLFKNELKALYNTLETQNAWHAEGLIAQFDEWQSQWPEELWRLDIERKYIRTYNSSHVNGKGDAQFLVDMAHGKKKYQRRQFERNQERYMASKFQSGVASSDENSIVIRCTNPGNDVVVKPNYSLTLTPFDYMYLNVEYSDGVIQMPITEPGVPVTVPYSGGDTDIVKIYSAYSLQQIGDLSPLYPRTLNAGAASKLKELIVGNGTEGYDNPHLTTLTTGANYLLEKLNIENVSGLSSPLDLSQLGNLRELYAHGSGVSGITFADGGRIEIAELPAINSATMKNLMYLVTLDIADLSKLISITVENCDSVDVLSILNAAPNLNRVRITDIDWSIDSTDLLDRLYLMAGFDKDGYNTAKSVLTGNVHIPLIYEKDLDLFEEAWPDLVITYDTLSPSHLVTFLNADGSVVATQYVDDGGIAVPPENPIMESSVMYDYTFAKWAPESMGPIYQPATYTAIYTESLREYAIRYESMGKVLYSATGPYGSNISYPSDYPIPTYDKEEPKTFYLFDGWDKSGFLTGDFDENGVRVINAKFTTYTHTGSLHTDLSEMSLAEIYAMNKLGLAKSTLEDVGDQFSFVIGNDFSYSDILDEVLVDSKMSFDGSTSFYDTGIKLFDKPKDFTLAIDYELLSGNRTGAVVAQCMQGHQDNGLRLSYSTGTFDGVKLAYGDKESNIVDAGKREMIVICYKASTKKFTFYKSALDSDSVESDTLSPSFDIPAHNHTLVFGAQKLNDNNILNYAACNIYWAKIWWADLGTQDCHNLALWTHESMSMTVCSFGEYSLSGQTADNTCSFTLLANHLLGRPKTWNKTGTNTGGWAESILNKSLNQRLYKAIPVQIRALMKQVVVRSSIGDGSTTCSESDCHIYIPAIIELDNSSDKKILPYTRECVGTISYIKGTTDRVRAFDGGQAGQYWTRSPNAGYVSNGWVYSIQATGSVYGNRSANSSFGVLIQISF